MMRWPYLSLFFFLGFQIADAQTLKWDKRFDQAVPEDWLVKPINTKANVYQTEKEGDLVLYNGLVRRSFRVAPNFACYDFQNMSSSQQLLRAIRPEAKLIIDGKAYKNQ